MTILRVASVWTDKDVGWLTKGAMGKLKKVIGKIVSKSQTTFVSGIQILDEILVLNQVIDLANREKIKFFLFKVDFAQAYDCIKLDVC